MMNVPQLACVIAAACLSSCSRTQDSWSASGNQPSTGNSPTPVLIELFTSEGCSSCPPADLLLIDLMKNQPIPPATIIGISEHVDYWDRLGWRDPFSSPGFTSRQSEYEARVFRIGSIYTPQLVIDGQFQEVGSDRTAVARSIARAARAPKAVVRLAATAVERGDAINVTVDLDIPPGLARREIADVMVAIAEDGLETQVSAGENHGRTLKHGGVARSVTVVGAIKPDASAFRTTAPIPLAMRWNRRELHAVAFVQERQSRRVLGAASARLP